MEEQSSNETNSELNNNAHQEGAATQISEGEAIPAAGIQVHEFEKSFEEKLEFIYDVPLIVSAELGRINMKINEILSLKLGSVIEIEKLAGEPLEILINDKLICRGEVIVVNEKYGIRMTDIVDPNENTELKTKTTQS